MAGAVGAAGAAGAEGADKGRRVAERRLERGPRGICTAKEEEEGNRMRYLLTELIRSI